MKFVHAAVLGAIMLAVSACISVKPVFAPDGKNAYTITCSGSSLDWAHCYQRASEICAANGYHIYKEVGDQSGAIAGSEGSILGSSSASRTLLIACKDGTEPPSKAAAAQ